MESSFANYYRHEFREDLKVLDGFAVCGHRPRAPRDEVEFQPKSLSVANRTLASWPDARRVQFALALFLTVLADQVCFTHFRHLYDRFRALTRYPKFIGDCPGGCSSNIHPKHIFSAIGQREGQRADLESFSWHLVPGDTTETMRAEILSFANDHLAGSFPDEFWIKCRAELPPQLRDRHEAS
jgi:hypothetical protein